MTSSICSSIPEGIEGQLEDTRDGQLYWIGKMKDGRCWMLQNLALGSTTSVTGLSSDNSNVTSSWVLPQAYTSPTSGSGSSSNYDIVQSWNFGKWVLATPLLTESCGNQSGGIAGCVKTGFVDVSDGTRFKPTFTAKTMTWNGANSNSDTLVAVNCTSWSGSGENKVCTAGTYDAHYLVGNYYSWGMATAGTGKAITYQDASGSICPKGWKLPTRGTSNTNGDFYKLMNAYGVSASPSGSDYNIAGKPLRFVRSGYVTPGYNIGYAGRDGYYWSSRANGSDNAYSLAFYSSSVDPSYNNARWYGRAVRCIAE